MRVWDPQVLVESLSGWKKCPVGSESQMPLPHGGGSIAQRLQHLSYGGLIQRQTSDGAWVQHTWVDTWACLIATCQQRRPEEPQNHASRYYMYDYTYVWYVNRCVKMCWGVLPGRAAHWAGAVKIREAESTCCQPVQVRSEGTGMSKTAQVTETQIICEQEDEIRRGSWGDAKQGWQTRSKANKIHSFHREENESWWKQTNCDGAFKGLSEKRTSQSKKKGEPCTRGLRFASTYLMWPILVLISININYFR